MVTDLTYLKKMTDGNPDLIREMIEIFTLQVEEYSTQMTDLLKRSEWTELSRLAHKAKSSLAIMGMKEMSGKLKELEILARDGQKINEYADYIDAFIRECKKAVSELKKNELL